LLLSPWIYFVIYIGYSWTRTFVEQKVRQERFRALMSLWVLTRPRDAVRENEEMYRELEWMILEHS